MELWHKMVFPVRRVWLAVSSRVKARKNGGGLLKLHNDVESCEYQDIKVMWEMLNQSETQLITTTTTTSNKRRLRPFWRVFVWPNHSSSSSSSSSSFSTQNH
ncbi:hypothetical protein LWI28_008805 [Acer negundo]|uniref:Uncharacterized protein n=1 Tax=Acer negundo TaxID=4023 RepID=A0AAD5NI71_ACENE|nr:hypothetical protein LWI28_008805 [Acer negundo]KAK4838362.1 hypothetical protein QYF36_013204 [Acer negundo]